MNGWILCGSLFLYISGHSFIYFFKNLLHTWLGTLFVSFAVLRVLFKREPKEMYKKISKILARYAVGRCRPLARYLLAGLDWHSRKEKKRTGTEKKQVSMAKWTDPKRHNNRCQTLVHSS